MTGAVKMKWIAGAVGLVVGFGVLAIDERQALSGQAAFTDASARVGRPATPVSYAGVARRTTRRAVAVGAAAASTRTCVQKVDAYGRIVTVCG